MNEVKFDLEKLVNALETLFCQSPLGHIGKDEARNRIWSSAQPLEGKDLCQHVRRSTRYGAIPFVDNDRVGWACLDLDADHYGRAADDSEIIALVHKAYDLLQTKGLFPWWERSKSRGHHI